MDTIERIPNVATFWKILLNSKWFKKLRWQLFLCLPCKIAINCLIVLIQQMWHSLGLLLYHGHHLMLHHDKLLLLLLLMLLCCSICYWNSFICSFWLWSCSMNCSFWTLCASPSSLFSGSSCSLSCRPYSPFSFSHSITSPPDLLRLGSSSSSSFFDSSCSCLFLV